VRLSLEADPDGGVDTEAGLEPVVNGSPGPAEPWAIVVFAAAAAGVSPRLHDSRPRRGAAFTPSRFRLLRSSRRHGAAGGLSLSIELGKVLFKLFKLSKLFKLE
jgi:hypothetical protein